MRSLTTWSSRTTGYRPYLFSLHVYAIEDHLPQPYLTYTLQHCHHFTSVNTDSLGASICPTDDCSEYHYCSFYHYLDTSGDAPHHHFLLHDHSDRLSLFHETSEASIIASLTESHIDDYLVHHYASHLPIDLDHTHSYFVSRLRAALRLHWTLLKESTTLDQDV